MVPACIRSQGCRRSAAGVIGRSGGCDRRRRKPQIRLGGRCERDHFDGAGDPIGTTGEQRAEETLLIVGGGPRVIRCVVERLCDVLERVQLASQLHADKEQRKRDGAQQSKRANHGQGRSDSGAAMDGSRQQDANELPLSSNRIGTVLQLFARGPVTPDSPTRRHQGGDSEAETTFAPRRCWKERAAMHFWRTTCQRSSGWRARRPRESGRPATRDLPQPW